MWTYGGTRQKSEKSTHLLQCSLLLLATVAAVLTAAVAAVAAAVAAADAVAVAAVACSIFLQAHLIY